MKAKLEDIPSEKGHSSFYAYRFQVPFFEFKWHYHPEYELTYIVKGNGYRIIGNSYKHYTKGDLVLLGGNLPHTWSGTIEDDSYSEAVVIQFSKELVESFLAFNESALIKEMLKNSEKGICFNGDDQLISNISELVETKGLERILKLLSILDRLSTTEGTFIASNTFHNVVSKKNEIRLNKVCQFIQSNFSSKISLKEVADLIYITESNFCKFFKKATGKTYSDYLNELRINEACRLLIQTEKTISQISFECGFETISYFNRVFNAKKGCTPSNYRKSN
ncbi:AraC family transcriptional regulator [Flavobacterium sp.]|uniref:AraC family transcriptional regulator n=1 Tax=Flavobacterium sp. TaxID=239 RepID=UPI002626B42E|nr:AraC family transcriptional regulator [Flavobacterium sp.]